MVITPRGILRRDENFHGDFSCKVAFSPQIVTQQLKRRTGSRVISKKLPITSEIPQHRHPLSQDTRRSNCAMQQYSPFPLISPFVFRSFRVKAKSCSEPWEVNIGKAYL